MFVVYGDVRRIQFVSGCSKKKLTKTLSLSGSQSLNQKVCKSSWMASQDQSSKEGRSKPQCRHCNVSPAVVSMWNDVNYFSALHPSRNACQLVLTCCGGEQQSSTASWFLETWQGICRSCQAGLANPVVKSPKSSKVLAALPSRTGCSAWPAAIDAKKRRGPAMHYILSSTIRYFAMLKMTICLLIDCLSNSVLAWVCCKTTTHHKLVR